MLHPHVCVYSAEICINKCEHSHYLSPRISKLTSHIINDNFIFQVEIVVGHLTGSMALVADAFHMLSDIVALIIAYISMVVSPKRWDKNTYGFARAEVLGALSNAVFLIALCFSILVEAIKVNY